MSLKPKNLVWVNFIIIFIHFVTWCTCNWKVLNKIDSSIQLCYSWYIVGSSTACIVALHKKERRLYTANLGDSGFLVIRDDQVVHRSQEQQHYFNTPFQLAVAPPSQAGLVLSDRLVIFFLFYSLIGKWLSSSFILPWTM